MAALESGGSFLARSPIADPCCFAGLDQQIGDAIHGRNNNHQTIGPADMSGGGTDCPGRSDRYTPEFINVDRRTHGALVCLLARASSSPVAGENTFAAS